MDRQDVVGTAQIAGGSYLGYQGLKHGLPRAAGIRIEYHTTSKENAKAIKKGGNILDPNFGGKNGWSAKVKSNSYIKNSTGYVHITGMHKDKVSSFNPPKGLEKYKSYLVAPFRTIFRKAQNLMYKTVGNIDFEELKTALNSKKSKSEKLTWASKKMVAGVFNNKTKRFCIPGIDSYFNSEFIADADDIALKSRKPLKVYKNRFSAMLAGLKKFGLKGIKENKGRAAFGAGLVALGLYAAGKLISKGIRNISK